MFAWKVLNVLLVAVLLVARCEAQCMKEFHKHNIERSVVQCCGDGLIAYLFTVCDFYKALQHTQQKRSQLDDIKLLPLHFQKKWSESAGLADDCCKKRCTLRDVRRYCWNID